jgi:iron complex transport system substrate-binding protein
MGYSGKLLRQGGIQCCACGPDDGASRRDPAQRVFEDLLERFPLAGDALPECGFWHDARSLAREEGVGLIKIGSWLLVACLACTAAQAEIVVRDDSGATLRLAQPARRIVSLAPHITEMLFAAGAGGHIIAAVDYSDHPAAAKNLPRIGNYSRLDLEAIATLKPELAVGWVSGNSPAHIDKIRALGIPVYLSEPARIDDVADDLERYGELAGTQAVAREAAAAFRNRLAALRGQYAARPRVRVFYQIWKQPLTTVGGGQVISDAIHLCGGENVFADLKPLAPRVTVEAVLAADPEVIVASGMDAARPEWVDDWRQWQTMTAVKRGNLFFIPPDLIQRHTPRLVEGAARLCAQIETARSKR